MFNRNKQSRVSINSYKEKHSLRVSFDQIKQIDPLGIQNRYQLRKDLFLK